MAEVKTKPTSASVAAFIRAIEGERKRKDAETLLALFAEASGEKPRMWGSSIIGFGMYRYQSERSAQHGDWPLIAFSPRKQALVLYVISGFAGEAALLRRLGKHRTSKACLYVNKLEDIDLGVLSQLVRKSFETTRRRTGA